MAVAVARAIHCELQPPKRVGAESSAVGSDQVKIVLQPRLCTLRSFGSDRGGVIRMMTSTKEGSGDGDEMEMTSAFMENLYEYIESTKKSQDFEIITGRLAMIVFAATMGVELATGNSVFKKMDVNGIEEGLGACLAAITCAAAFAYFSSARKKVGKIFTISCNAFIDGLIDNIVDSLFYESDEYERSDNKENL